jgi:Ca2+/H+ antiporter, TMEM165/GDT1 family
MIPDLNPLWVSTGVVALAEMGDKTQLLALILAARYQRPWPIILGILIATLMNHGLAGALGHWIGASMDPIRLQLILSLTFLFMAFWILVPDRCDEDVESKGTLGVLAATFVSFFLAEMGDKTQIATIALAAHQSGLSMVVLGTTLGMMIANVPMVFLGDRIAEKLPVRATRVVAALLFLGLAITAFIRTEMDLQTLIQDGVTTLQELLERIP